jgi:hypothetical protein
VDSRCKKCAAVRRVLCFARSKKGAKRPDKGEKLGAGGGLGSAGAGRGASWRRVGSGAGGGRDTDGGAELVDTGHGGRQWGQSGGEGGGALKQPSS